MTCAKCGTEMPDGYKYTCCPKCGWKPEMADSAQAKVPESLAACLAQDETAGGLLAWGNGLKKWGKILAIVVAVFGVIVSITGAIVTDGYTSDFSFPLLLTSLLQYALEAILIYAAFYSLSLLISGLGKIVQNTKNQAKLLEYQIMRTENK